MIVKLKTNSRSKYASNRIPYVQDCCYYRGTVKHHSIRIHFQNELTKKKRTGDYPKQPNRRLGDIGVNTPSSMGTPSATSTKDPVIDTDSNDDVSTSVVDTRKMAPVNDTSINNSRMQMEDMEPYHKFSNRTDQQVHDNLREKHFVLAKGYYQLVNELNHYKGRNSVQNSSIRGYQDSSISAALSERRSRLAKIEPIHQLSQRL